MSSCHSFVILLSLAHNISSLWTMSTIEMRLSKKCLSQMRKIFLFFFFVYIDANIVLIEKKNLWLVNENSQYRLVSQILSWDFDSLIRLDVTRLQYFYQFTCLLSALSSHVVDHDLYQLQIFAKLIREKLSCLTYDQKLTNNDVATMIHWYWWCERLAQRINFE